MKKNIILILSFLVIISVLIAGEENYILPTCLEGDLGDPIQIDSDTHYNLAIILCVDYGQSIELDIDDYITPLEILINDYFVKASFGEFEFARVKVMVASENLSTGKAIPFVLHEYLQSGHPAISPENINGVLADADGRYNFNEFDSKDTGDPDFAVDFLVVAAIRFSNDVGVQGTGSMTLLNGVDYTTNDTDGYGHSIIIRNQTQGTFAIRKDAGDSYDKVIQVIVHEFGHVLLDAPDRYAKLDPDDPHSFATLGDFSCMSSSGFEFRPSLYTPMTRISGGWDDDVTITEYTSDGTHSITLTDFEQTKIIYKHNTENPQLQTPMEEGTYYRSNWQEYYWLTYYGDETARTNYWYQKWPIPQDPVTHQKEGLLIWRDCWKFSDPISGGFEPRTIRLSIESAHGRWDW